MAVITSPTKMLMRLVILPCLRAGVLFLLLLLANADFAHAAKQRPGGDDPIVAQVESAMTEGDFERAVQLLGAAIQKSPKGLYYAMRGGLRGESRDLSGAIEDLTEAVKLDPKLAVAWRDRGTARVLRGELALARVDFDTAVGLDREEPKAWAARAALHVQMGAADAAIADATEALRLDPQMTNALYDRGSAQVQKGDYRTALADFDALLAAQPLHALALASRAQVHRQLGDLKSALRDADRATQLDANFASAYIERATIHGVLGDFQRAIADCSTALLIDPEHRDGLMIRALLHLQGGRFALARDDFETALRSSRTDPAVARHNLAWLLAASPDATVRDADRAMVLAREAIERYGDKTPHVYDALAAACAEQGDFPSAIEHAEYALSLTTTRTPLELASRRHRVELYRTQRVFRLPLPTAEPASSTPSERIVRVEGMLRGGDYAGAIGLLEEAIRHSATPPASALIAMAWLLATCPDDAYRDGTRALGLARRAVARGGGASARDALAAASAEMGDFPGAVEAAQQAVDMTSPEDSAEVARRRARLEHYRNAGVWRLPTPPRAAPKPAVSFR
jgi:tetratricopeptide (TPR) repeat protein